MLEQHAYDFDTPTHHRYVQRGRQVLGPRVYVCTLLEQHAYNLDPSYVPRGRAVVGPHVRIVLGKACVYDTLCRFVQWGSSFLVLHTHIRAMLEQQAYELDLSISGRYVQWS